MKKILFISSSRADYGLLRNVIFETKKNKKIKVFILVSGSHLSTQFGNTVKEIEKDGLKKNIIKKKILKKNFFENDISNYISETISATSNVLDKIKPEKIVILGDRYELLGSAIASMSHRIPIAHIHGGEVTKGAYELGTAVQPTPCRRERRMQRRCLNGRSTRRRRTLRIDRCRSQLATPPHRWWRLCTVGTKASVQLLMFR